MLAEHYSIILTVGCLAVFLLVYCLVALWRRTRRMQSKVCSLQHDLAQIETIYANAPLGLATLDDQLRYVRINKLLAQINGLAVEDHVGKTLREVVPNLAEQAEKPFVQVLRSGTPISGIIFEGTTSSKLGVNRVWRENVHPIFSKNRKVVGINVSVEEVTEEKKLNDALRASELRERKRATELEVVMNATPAAVFIAHDTACRDVTGNKEAMRLLRLGPGENPSLSAPGGRPFKVFADGVLVATEELPLQVAAATGKEVRAAELSIHFPDDKLIHVLMNAAPVRDEMDNVIGAAAAFVDVTAQKQANETLMQEARRKDEFLAILAHELRNPLAAIQTGLELMKHGPASSPSQSRTRHIMERQVSHLVRLIADLLDVSRIGSGKLELTRERLSVKAMIDDAVEVCRSHIETAGQELMVHVPRRLIYVEADNVRMEQVITNLLNNASKYTPEGGCIRVEVEEDGKQVFIHVIDNGIGIENKMLSKVFDMFSQTESGRLWRKGGIGIGLSLAKQIVEMHGGRLMVESAGLGLGSKFTLSMPCFFDSKSTPQTPDGTSDAYSLGQEMRILIVDDNVDAAQTLGSLFELSGHIVQLAHTGADAVEKSRKFLPGIVFLDIGLPDMSGLEVARILRKEKELQGTTLVALTGWGTPKDKDKTAVAGFAFHLTKPVTLEAIQNILPGLRMS